MSGNFQRIVNRQPAPAIEGDFADSNPRSVMQAGPGGLIAGPLGVTAGRFAWVDTVTGIVTNAQPVAGPNALRIGFVTIHQSALNVNWPSTASGLAVQGGQEITVHEAAGVWVKFAAAANTNQKVFVNTADGTVQAGAAGAAIAGAVETPFFVNSVAAAGEVAKISTRG